MLIYSSTVQPDMNIPKSAGSKSIALSYPSTAQSTAQLYRYGQQFWQLLSQSQSHPEHSTARVLVLATSTAYEYPLLCVAGSQVPLLRATTAKWRLCTTPHLSSLADLHCIHN